jgi:tRNA/rRNA methyltransferase
MRIPTREEHGSMNLGQAVAVCLYELVRGRKTTAARTALGKKEKKSARSREVERLTQMLLEVLGASGYVKPRAVAAEEKLRRLVRRLELNADDTAVWLGMLRQIAWKLGVGEKDGPS